MNNKTGIWIAGIVIVVALAYFFWPTQKVSAPTQTAKTTQQTAAATSPAATTTAPVAEAAFVGSWKSQQDAKFVRTFSADGSVTDTYTGDAAATSKGTWSIVANVAAEPVTLPNVSGETVLKLVFPKMTMYFAVTQLSSTNLSMNYLNGNGSLNFTKI